MSINLMRNVTILSEHYLNRFKYLIDNDPLEHEQVQPARSDTAFSLPALQLEAKHGLFKL